MKINKEVKKAIKTIKENNSQLYFYSGFDKPKKIDINNIIIKDSYIGDISEDIMLEISELINHYQIKELKKYQELPRYFWIDPTLGQLQAFNKRVGLDKNDYLHDFIKKNI